MYNSRYKDEHSPSVDGQTIRTLIEHKDLFVARALLDRYKLELCKEAGFRLGSRITGYEVPSFPERLAEIRKEIQELEDLMIITKVHS